MALRVFLSPREHELRSTILRGLETGNVLNGGRTPFFLGPPVAFGSPARKPFLLQFQLVNRPPPPKVRRFTVFGLYFLSIVFVQGCRKIRESPNQGAQHQNREPAPSFLSGVRGNFFPPLNVRNRNKSPFATGPFFDAGFPLSLCIVGRRDF